MDSGRARLIDAWQFLQVVNYNHFMPTRYALELESLKNSVSDETLREASQRIDAKKSIKKVSTRPEAGGSIEVQNANMRLACRSLSKSTRQGRTAGSSRSSLSKLTRRLWRLVSNDRHGYRRRLTDDGIAGFR